MGQCPKCGGEYTSDAARCPADGSTLDVAPADPLRGTVLADTYRIVRRAAIGGMGRVYEAEHTRLDRRYAVKVIHEAQAHRPQAVQRFMREARETGRLKSEHIVEVFDLIELPDGRPSMVAEFLLGENLQERLDRIGELTTDEATAIAIEVCRGLEIAHAAGVIHRDLKPSNVFLSTRPEGARLTKILDFGVAKVADDAQLTQTGAFIGTAAFMAPEQAAGDAELDHRADIYAVGALLYCMVAGAPPYGREDPALTLRKLLQGEPPRLRSVQPRVPPALEAIIERAMARDPNARYQTTLELRRELVSFAAIRSEPSQSGRFSVPKASKQPIVGPRLTAAMLAAIAALVSVAWGASLAGALLTPDIDLEALRDFEKTALRISPALLGLAVLGPCVRGLMSAWRSGPRVVRLANALRASLSWGLGLFAVLQLALTAYGRWPLEPRNVPPTEQALAVLVPGAAGLIAFLISYLNRRPR